ncbi:hypothetical protein, partial [Streptococcus pseudopneumoniae]|uniref:hypothetical protein n=1 Tax=Streptococcus pseudopneumoniae TaxID=257758 RepID=UPI0019D65799
LCIYRLHPVRVFCLSLRGTGITNHPIAHTHPREDIARHTGNHFPAVLCHDLSLVSQHDG